MNMKSWLKNKNKFCHCIKMLQYKIHSLNETFLANIWTPTYITNHIYWAEDNVETKGMHW